MEDREIMVAVASGYYEDRMKQGRLAELFGISQAKVCRLLEQARDEGIVRISVEPFRPRRGDLEKKLAKKLAIQRAIVVKSWFAPGSENCGTLLARYASHEVADMLLKHRVIAVTGGRTVKKFVDAVITQNKKQPSNMTILQSMGNIDQNLSPFDAVELGKKLAENFGGNFISLNAPAIADSRKIRDSFLSHKQISQVLEQISQAKALLTGIGTVDNSIFAKRGTIFEADKIILKKAGAVGDICGRFFDSNGNECPTSFRDRVIGITIGQLKKIPNVIAVASGGDKITVIKTACGNSMINTLVTDETTAAMIIEGSDE